MPPLESILAVALAGLALSATPGPSMLYVLSRTVGQSRSAGVASALGLCLGGVLLAIATAWGLGSVFMTFDALVLALKYLGAAYLVWLGLGMIREARATARQELAATKVDQRPLAQVMWQGVLVELLNPKTVLFFALFLPPFVALDQRAADAGDVTLQLLLLGILVPLTAIPADLVVAWMGGAMARTLNESRKAREVMAWAGGLVLIGIAASLVWDSLRTALF
ncbi:MAG: RhtB family transporter [Xanthobacteraceae bacterium]|nr:MAG: RhtB family transporter [Xanthobacteraceae bacterium]